MHRNLALLETWARVHIAAFLDEHLGSLSEESATHGWVATLRYTVCSGTVL